MTSIGWSIEVFYGCENEVVVLLTQILDYLKDDQLRAECAFLEVLSVATEDLQARTVEYR